MRSGFDFLSAVMTISFSMTASLSRATIMFPLTGRFAMACDNDLYPMAEKVRESFLWLSGITI